MDSLYDRLVIKENRIGKVCISDEVIINNLKLFMDEFLSKVFIVKMEHVFPRRFECICYSDFFESNELGNIPLEYTIMFERDEDGVSKFIKAMRIE